MLLLVACREGSASTTLALPCAATALAAALSTSNLDALRAATIATAAYATAPASSWKALAAVVAPESDVARSVDVDVDDLARLLKRHGVQVPASAYDDHVVDERRRKAWRLVGAALLTALVAVVREMMM